MGTYLEKGGKMIVKFYQNDSDDRKVDKHITLKKSLATVIIKEDSSIMRPVLKVHMDSDIMKCNYVEISSWNRYYYIDNITVASGQMLIITCREDVLMSNKTQLYKTSAFVQRSEKGNANMYINDQLFLSTNKPIIDYLLFSKDLKFSTEKGSFSLAIAGGGT